MSTFYFYGLEYFRSCDNLVFICSLNRAYLIKVFRYVHILFGTNLIPSEEMIRNNYITLNDYENIVRLLFVFY